MDDLKYFLIVILFICASLLVFFSTYSVLMDFQMLSENSPK